PSLATNSAASSRASTTTLSSPEVEPEDAEDPADEAPPEVPAKLPAWAASAVQAKRTKPRTMRVIGGSACGGRREVSRSRRPAHERARTRRRGLMDRT